MEREKLEKLYEAIKSDNEKLFSSFMLSKSDLNICFGRFPILSLCYLYRACKILLKYEKYLMPINKFEVVPEYFSMYKDFKRYAKKSLRLYACNNKIVYPIEMLAILDERKLISHKYKFLFKNEEILQNVQKIYILNKKIEIIATREKFECEAKKINFKQKIIAGATAFVFLVLSVFSFICVTVMKNSFGVGTEKYPIYISTSNELELALQKGYRYYVLENDIVLSKDFSVGDFSGTLVGNDKTIILSGEQSDSLIQNLTGTIENVNFEFELKNKNFTESFAILAQNNAGIIQNCDFSGIINCEVGAEGDIFVSAVTVENAGTIDGVRVELNSVIKNLGETNAYLSGVAGKNTGVISNTKTLESKFEADTVDLSGLVGENRGTISACENNTELDQISNSKDWNPNCAGISMQNFGTIENSVNNAKVLAESTASQKPIQDGVEGEIAVIVGGIVADNYNEIKNSLNFGNVSAVGDASMTYAGGIACRNIIDEVKAVIENSVSKCEIVSNSKNNFAYAGGVSALNYQSAVKNSGFEGVIKADSLYDFEPEIATDFQVSVYVGGIVGFHNSGTIDNSYANVSYEDIIEPQSHIKKMHGGIVGFVGVGKIYQSIGNGLQFFENGAGLMSVTNCYYVKDNSVKYACFGRSYIAIPFMYEYYYEDYGIEQIAPDGEFMIMVENISDIPSEVRIYE